MAVVTPTDRPKSVSNRCVNEVVGCVFVLSRCILDFSVDVGAFVTGLSQISSSFSSRPSFRHLRPEDTFVLASDWFCFNFGS